MTVDGIDPRETWTPHTAEELLQMVQRATDEGLAVIPWGGGTSMSIGFPPTRYDVALSTRSLNRLVDHQQFDLTATAQAGMTLAELNAHLAKAGQRLPCDPPHPERVTLGGMLATNVSGPLRHSFGTPRELVLGMKMALSSGRSIQGGGRVVKNVAGYDLVRLFVGSSGTLGVIFEASFKVLPQPQVTRLVVIPCDSAESCEAALQRLTSAEFSLASLELLSDGALQLYAGLEGDAEFVDWQVNRIPGGSVDETPDRAAWLRDYPLDNGAPVTLRVNLLSSDLCRFLRFLPAGATALGSAGVGVLRLFLKEADADAVARLRGEAETLGGTLVVERAPTELKAQVDVWGEVGDSLPLMRQIKATVDPSGIFSPGRFIGRL